MEESKHTPIKLQEDVAKEFEVVGTTLHKFAAGKFGIVDLNTLNVNQARALVERKFPYLKAKKATVVEQKKESK